MDKQAEYRPSTDHSDPLDTVIKARAAYVDAQLATLYPDPAIPLHHTSPYTLLIAVLLSARSTDAGVNRVTPILFKEADTPEAMAGLSIQQVQSIIRPCGLSAFKARSIVELSKILLEKYHGQVPSDWEALESLPGIGHKSASVVRSQAFGLLAFPVDTHIQRLARRWRFSSGRSPLRIEKDLQQLFPAERWHKLHLQFIYYAREYCTARKCDGKRCPICKYLAETFPLP